MTSKNREKNKSQEAYEDLFESNTGMKVKLFYGPSDITKLDYKTSLGDPGIYPYTRGIYPTMYRDKLWTMRQYAGFSTSDSTNNRFKFLLEQGQTGLSLALDLPTQLGLDSDDPLAEHDVGKLGVAIDTLQDMEEIFEDIPLDRISTSLTVNSTACIILAMYLATAEKQACSVNKLRGTIQNDIIKEFIARGTQIFPLDHSIKLIGDTIEFCMTNLPKFNPVSVSGTHISECGATPTQAVAYPILAAICYIEEVLKRGYRIDDIAPLLSFHLTCGGERFNFIHEIAKLRATRRLWSRIMKERFGSQSSKSQALRFSTGGMGSGMTEQQPLNNIARIAFYALAAAFGGTRSMNLPCFDEAFAVPTDEAIRTSLRIQQIIAYEIGVPDVVDPLGGSYYLEALTDDFENEIMNEMEKINAEDGFLGSVNKGIIQKKLAKQAFENQMKIEERKLIIVGVNQFQSKEEERELEILEVDPETVTRQKEKLARVKRERSLERIKTSLKEVKETAKSGGNLMPPILNAVKAYATVGEIVNELKSIYGEAPRVCVF